MTTTHNRVHSILSNHSSSGSLHERQDSSVSTSSSNTSSSLTTHLRKSVSFDSVQIHQHAIVLGDNPAVSSGLPIALGGRYGTDVMGVDEYEAYERRRGGGGGGTTARIWSKHDRANLLRGTHTPWVALKARRELKRIQKSREEATKDYMEDKLYF